MNYFLQGTIGRPSRVPITEQEFNALRDAKKTLAHFMTLTKTYRVVGQSYRAVERAKHDAELDNILHSKVGYHDSLDSSIVLNSPIVAYLAIARFFLDSTDKLLPDLLEPESLEAFTRFKHGVYDGSAEYRFIEALRNYVLHRNLPIHVLTYHSFVEDKSNIPDSEFVTCLSLKAKREALTKDKKFKQSALEGLPEAIDIIDCIRFCAAPQNLIHVL